MPACHAGDRGFESRQLRQFYAGGRGEVVNAPDCGSGIRGFDSHRSPHVGSSQAVRQRTLTP